MALNITVELLPKYPVQIVGGAGIDVSSANGITTLSLDITEVDYEPNPDLTTFTVLGEQADGSLARATVFEAVGNAVDDATDAANAAIAAAAAAVEVSGALPRGNRAFIKALDTGVLTTAWLNETGREGMFAWKAGDYSAFISEDTSEGVYIKANAIASSSGAWVRVCEHYNPVWFGANYAYSNPDIASALQAAVDLAAISTDPVEVVIPPGRWSISASVSPPQKATISGAGWKSTVLVPLMTDGSGVIAASTALTDVTLRNFQIAGSWTSGEASWKAGTGTAQNCRGLDLRAGVSYFTHYTIENVWIEGCSIGADLDGFIGVTNSLYIRYCDTGFIGTNLNSVKIDIITEWNRKAFAITNSFGLNIPLLLAEDVIANTEASTIDASRVVTVGVAYFERDATYSHANPYLIVGGSTQVTSFNMHVDMVGAHEAEVPYIKLDRVRGAKVRGYANYSIDTCIETTANCSNIDIFLEKDFGNNHDNSLVISTPINYFPNPQFGAWLRGWTQIALSNAAIAQETSFVRRGPNAMKIYATVSTTQNNVIFVSNEAGVGLRSKTVRVGAWIWVPNIDEYENYAGVAVTHALVGLSLRSNNGSASVTSTARNTSAARGQWNYAWNTVTMQSDATSMQVIVYPNQTNNSATGNEYIIVDEITVVDVQVPLDRQMRGEVSDGPWLPHIAGNRVELYADATPTDANQTYVAGDKVWRLAPSAGGSPGWVCTTGGAGGTAVWKAMASVAA